MCPKRIIHNKSTFLEIKQIIINKYLKIRVGRRNYKYKERKNQ